MLSLIKKYRDKKRRKKNITKQVFSCFDLIKEISSYLDFYTWWSFRCVSHNTFTATKKQYQQICAQTIYADLTFYGWVQEKNQYRLYIPANILQPTKNIKKPYYICACNGCRNAEKLTQKVNRKNNHCVCCDCFDCVCILRQKNKLFSPTPNLCSPYNCKKKKLNDMDIYAHFDFNSSSQNCYTDSPKKSCEKVSYKVPSCSKKSRYKISYKVPNSCPKKSIYVYPRSNTTKSYYNSSSDESSDSSF